MQQCGYAGSVLIIAGGKLQPLHQSGGEIYSAEHCRQGNFAPLPVSVERGRAGEARLEFLSFDGIGGRCAGM